MLKQRVFTAIILAAIFIAALTGLSAAQFPFFIAVVVLIGAWEWARLSNYKAPWQTAAYCALVAIAMIAIGWAAGLHEGSLHLPIIKALLVTGCAWWMLGLVLVGIYPTASTVWGHSFSCLMMGLLVLIPTWVALVYVRFQPYGAWLILMIVGVVAAADTGGYFTGRKLGKRKLAPEVSPGKTLEGFLGGLVSNLLLAVLIAWLSGSHLIPLLAIIVPTSLFSVLGDLMESMVKRHAGVKDSGRILPGHGGILDRVDSITAAAPVFALALMLSGWTPGG